MDFFWSGDPLFYHTLQNRWKLLTTKLFGYHHFQSFPIHHFCCLLQFRKPNFPYPSNISDLTGKRESDKIHKTAKWDYWQNPTKLWEKIVSLPSSLSFSCRPPLTLTDIQHYVFTQPCTLALPFPCWEVSAVRVCWKAFTGASSLATLS